MRAKLAIALVTVGAGAICLAPVAQADETAPDRTTSGDSNFSLSLAPTIGDADTSLGLRIDVPDAESLHLGAPIGNLEYSVGFPQATEPTLRLCLTCRR